MSPLGLSSTLDTLILLRSSFLSLSSARLTSAHFIIQCSSGRVVGTLGGKLVGWFVSVHHDTLFKLGKVDALSCWLLF